MTLFIVETKMLIFLLKTDFCPSDESSHNQMFKLPNVEIVQVIHKNLFLRDMINRFHLDLYLHKL